MLILIAKTIKHNEKAKKTHLGNLSNTLRVEEVTATASGVEATARLAGGQWGLGDGLQAPRNKTLLQAVLARRRPSSLRPYSGFRNFAGVVAIPALPSSSAGAQRHLGLPPILIWTKPSSEVAFFVH